MPEVLLETNSHSNFIENSNNIKHVNNNPVSKTGLDSVKIKTFTNKYSIDHKTMAIRADSSPLHRVFRQLLEACLFEKIIDYVSVDNTKSESSISKGTRTTFYFSIAGQSFVCQGRLRGFDRIRLYIRSLKRIHTGKPNKLTVLDIENIIKKICLFASPKHHHKLHQELQHSLHWWSLILKNHSSERNWNAFSYQDYETTLYEGHPYHPCFKARIGFSQNDHNHFSPENSKEFQLFWLAVPKSAVTHKDIPCLDTFWKSELDSNLYSDLCLILADKNFLPEEFTFIPCHPWQWNNYLEPKLRVLIDTGKIIFLGRLGENYIASQSVRTVLNVDTPTSAHLKFPLDIVSTSSTRYLMRYGLDTCNSLCSFIQSIIEKDYFFKQNPLLLLQEYAGIRVDESFYQDSTLDHFNDEISHFSVLFRESIESRLDEGESAVPLNALFSHNNNNDYCSCIDDWINEYGLENWLSQTLTTVVLPIWHLLVSHGIALEAHGQNLILIHKKGWPIRIAIRDVHESLEFVPDFLNDDIKLSDFETLNTSIQNVQVNERYAMDNIEALRWLVMDTLFIFNLSELAEFLDAKWQFPEDIFWKMLKNILNEYQNSHPHTIKRQKALSVFNSQLITEALFTRKCRPMTHNGIEHEYEIIINNPLS